MKTLIIYFSQSGNTEKVAKYIRDGMMDLVDVCDLKKMSDVDLSSLKDYDIVGLGAPVYYYKEPFNVSDWMDGLPNLEGRNWFVFCTHGSVLGLTLFSMADRLKPHGIKIIGTHHTYADAFLPFYPHPTYTTGHPDKQDLAEARAFGNSIVKCHLELLKGNTECVKEIPPLTEGWVKNELSLYEKENLSNMMPKLSINKDLCIACGDCEEKCPVDGIDVDSDRIQNPCIYCYQCAIVCPVCAIETDWSILVSYAPMNYKKYEEALLSAEKRGEFRWLMDRKSLDLDTPLYVKLQWKADVYREKMKDK